MFEKVPQKIPDPRALVDACMLGIKEEEKFYGPAFTPRFIKSALNFVARKIGEKPPENIKTLDQLADYLVSISDKYPIPANAIPYAGYKMEKLFEGQVGVGTRVSAAGASRNIGKRMINKEINVDTEDILSKYRQATIAMKVPHEELGYKRNTDGTIDILWKCYIREACQLALDDGLLKRPGGGLQCGSCQFLCQLFKQTTGHECDYDLLEINKPQCITRIYIL
ncbi:MAG: hypothetical protein WED07_00625 [Candidatus Freyarchaeum deiterrae]